MSVERAVVKKPPRQTVAAAISAIVHPVALPLLTLVVVTFTVTGQLRQGLELAAAALLLTTAPVAALVAYQVMRGRWTDLDVSVREQRYILYPIGLVFAALLIAAFVAMRAPIPAMATALSLALANAVDGVINFAYKVSAHTTAAAGCAALLWLYSPGWGLPVAIAAALVGWSRVELGRHTTGQVILGWGVGVASALAIYFFYAA
jgi:membrane-associated phospholipid phosphatase